MKSFRKLTACVLVVIMILMSVPMTFAIGDAAQIGSDSPYELSLATGYNGSALVTFYAKGTSLSADIVDADSAVFATVDLSSYVTDSDYTKLSLLVYNNTGKYMIYSGENDAYRAQGTFDVSFGRLFKGVVLSSDFASVKDAQINEFVRKYTENEKNVVLDVNYDKWDDGIEPTAIESDVGKKPVYRYTYAGVEDDGYNYYVSSNKNYYYLYNTVTNPLYGKAMRMSSKSYWSDQAVRFNNTVIDGMNYEITAEILLPALENKNTYTKTDLAVIYSTMDNGWRMPIVRFMAQSSTDEGATFAAFDASGNKLFNVPIDSENARDKWIKVNITADMDAQKYIITLEYDGKIVDSMYGVASTFVSGKYDHYVLKTFSPGYVVATGTAYMKNFKVYTLPRGEEETMNLSEQNIRSFVNDTTIAELRDAADSLKCGIGDITDGIALDTLGPYDAAISWESSNPDVVTNMGVVHPRIGEKCDVTLTATLTKGFSTFSRRFDITVPSVQPYAINAVKVTGDDGIIDSFLVGGKSVSAVNIKRYSENGGAVLAVLALYNKGKLDRLAMNLINTVTIERYGEGFVELSNPLKLPDALTDDYVMKVTLIEAGKSLKPLATAKSFGVQSENPSIYICSDSTACHYDEATYYPRTGWGDALAKLIKSGGA